MDNLSVRWDSVLYWDVRPHGTIVDGTTFEHLTGLETRQALRLQYAVSVLSVHPRVSDAQARDAERFAPQLVDALSPLIRSGDVIGMTGSAGRMRVLLIGSELDGVAVVSQRLIAETELHRFGDPTVTLSIGGSCFPTTANDFRELLGQADALAEQVHLEQPSASAYRLPRA